MYSSKLQTLSELYRNHSHPFSVIWQTVCLSVCLSIHLNTLWLLFCCGMLLNYNVQNHHLGNANIFHITENTQASINSWLKLHFQQTDQSSLNTIASASGTYQYDHWPLLVVFFLPYSIIYIGSYSQLKIVSQFCFNISQINHCLLSSKHCFKVQDS